MHAVLIDEVPEI